MSTLAAPLVAPTAAHAGVTGQSGESRLLSAAGPSLADHLARFGGMPVVAGTLMDELRDSGLFGRGGAAFPTWRKLASARGGAALVIANGAEGEPLSSKDAVLLQRAPHLVIDGLLAVGRLVGARHLVVFATTAQLEHVGRAVAERTDASMIDLREAPGIFISGEASAALNTVRSGRAVPMDHRLPLTTGDGARRPTVVLNVETLADVALIARFGADWFRSTGTPDEPGTRLLTLAGDVPRPGVIEVAGGAPLRDALARSGVDPSTVRAVLVGGYHGAWLPGTAIATPLGREALRPFGAEPGAGVLLVLGAGRCGIREASAIATYLAGQSAGQCGPCVNGLPAMADTLASVAAMDRNPSVVDRVRRLAGLVTGRGSCHHPDGTARLVLSTLTVFADDVRSHQAGSCREAAR
jgi:NADH:ubiquinone oxidoreductase subunit F (NADH-binding)